MMDSKRRSVVREEFAYKVSGVAGGGNSAPYRHCAWNAGVFADGVRSSYNCGAGRNIWKIAG